MEVVASLSQGRTAAAQCGLFTHSLPCLRLGKSIQALRCRISVQFLIAPLIEHLGIPRAGCGPEVHTLHRDGY